MSRLSDILGVKEGQEFRFDNNSIIYKMIGNVLYYYRETDDIWSDYYGFTIYDMIAHSDFIEIIPEKPELAEQQITAIKGRIAEGTPWATRRKGESVVWFCKKEPKSFEMPFDVGTACTPLYDFVTFENSPIYLPDLIEE